MEKTPITRNVKIWEMHFCDHLNDDNDPNITIKLNVLCP